MMAGVLGTVVENSLALDTLVSAPRRSLPKTDARQDVDVHHQQRIVNFKGSASWDLSRRQDLSILANITV